MTALYIILGIIAFICLVLLVKVRIDAEYIDGFKLSVSWLFLHFSIYPKTNLLSPKRKNPKKKSRKSPQRKNPKSPISLKPSMKTRVWTA